MEDFEDDGWDQEEEKDGSYAPNCDQLFEPTVSDSDYVYLCDLGLKFDYLRQGSKFNIDILN